MSSRLPAQPEAAQLRLGFERQRGDDARTRQFYCDTCGRWVARELYDLWHPPGHPPRRPYATDEGDGTP